MRRASIALVLGLITVAAYPAVNDTRFVVKVGQFGPRAEVRFARPTLMWEIWPADSQARVQSVALKLDGKAVDAQYDPRARAVKYTPNKPMATGPHEVECRITFEGGAYFDKRWTTRISESPITAFPAPSADQIEAISVTNDLRRALGLTPMITDERLNLAASLHSEYLAKNNATGHGEKRGTPGFLGESGADRLEAYGYVGSCWEDVGFGSQRVTEAVKDLFDAPYHRIPFMQPGLIALGAGFADQRTTLEFGAADETGTVVSPANGQTGVPCSWQDFERPNPLRLYDTRATVTGYPIVLAHFAPGLPRLRDVTATLTGPRGEEIACWLNTPDNDDALTGAAILIPQLPLKPKTSYTATFTGDVEEGGHFEKTIRFMTGPRK